MHGFVKNQAGSRCLMKILGGKKKKKKSQQRGNYSFISNSILVYQAQPLELTD